MLDNQDLVVIREIVSEEIGGKTSNLRQNVSNIQQDVTGLKQKVSNIELRLDDLGRQMHVLHEDMKSEFRLLIENIGGMIKEALTPVKEKVFENHETRISTLEMVVKKKLA
jgi:peptidoglycan hydrolase CwlO-like protein